MTLMMREQEYEEKGSEKINTLNKKLIKENRLDDMIRATEDKEYQEKLLKEFGIE